jgi:hypothetical protein
MMDDLSSVPQMEPVQPESRPASVKKNKAALESVQADTVQLEKSNANLIEANTVNIQDGGVRQIHGQTVSITGGGVGIAHANHLTITNGDIVICSSSDANVNGNVAVMIGQSVTLNNHRTGLVITKEVHGGPTRSIIFLAGKSDAPVETIVDQRSVALFGLATGVAMGLVLSLFRLLKR